MKQKSAVELGRQRISLLLRAQASIVRAEFLNRVLPAALDEYDRRIASGESMEIEVFDVNELIDHAVEMVSGTALPIGGDDAAV